MKTDDTIELPPKGSFRLSFGPIPAAQRKCIRQTVYPDGRIDIEFLAPATITALFIPECLTAPTNSL